ncbi:MAG TPA: DUF1801 domain-containing protein [Lutibacter sp.]|nr:DUF1801 domain-containing protein [Lutibacter sp.]
MLREIDNFYLEQTEPNRSFMLGIRGFILNYHKEITEEWKWKLPFFYYKGKPFCYVWKVQKTQQAYLCIVRSDLFEHPQLIQGNRKKMKALYFDVTKDIPINLIDEVLQLAMKYYP